MRRLIVILLLAASAVGCHSFERGDVVRHKFTNDTLLVVKDSYRHVTVRKKDLEQLVIEHTELAPLDEDVDWNVFRREDR